MISPGTGVGVFGLETNRSDPSGTSTIFQARITAIKRYGQLMETSLGTLTSKSIGKEGRHNIVCGTGTELAAINENSTTGRRSSEQTCGIIFLI